MEFQRRHRVIFFIVTILLLIFFIVIPNQFTNRLSTNRQVESQIEVKLPSPVFSSKTSIEEALKKRRSLRSYKNLPITLQEVGQLLWAAQGITADNGFPTAPSAGALYPLEIYLVAGNIEKLIPGIYHYIPAKHTLQKLKEGDARIQLAKAAIGQEPVKFGAADIVITAVFSRTTKKYGNRGTRFVLMEAGHVAQNIYLEAASLNLGTVSIGAFDDTQIKYILNIKEEDPLYILPIGKI
ncbi:MAG: SagB/ThcOx family dehydrogenase [Gammaproteobacteria bacterium]